MQPLLTIEHLSKVFPGQVALDDVQLEIKAGSTHALVGQNGSGKSTLIKILAGYHEPTGVPIAVFHPADGVSGDERLELGNGGAADAAGIRFVHQDLGLVDTVSTVENLALGGGYITRFGRIDWKAETKRANDDLAVLGFDDFDVRAPVGSLAPSQKTAVALARALRGWENGARLLVLDEPTASLPGADVVRLFDAIRRVKERGVAILYVSHHLEEVFEIADEVTILRDGKNVATMPIGELDHERLIELMVGHVVERRRALVPGDRGPVLLDVHQVSGGNVRVLDVQVHTGEVVGVAGITGSGREHVIPLVSGQLPSTDGRLYVGDIEVPPFAPRAAIAAGMAFVSADRQSQGNFATLSVTANTTMSDVKRNSQGPRLVHARERAEAEGWVTKLRTKTASTESPMATLSGGNQQKVLFARGLRLRPKVIVLDEPTRGIDVGAKEEIHSLIDQAAAEGSAVLVASTDTEELVRLSHRIIIMRDGVIATELLGDEITVENIERAQLQQTQQTAEPAHAAPAKPGRNWTTKLGLDKYSALYLWALFMIVFSTTSEQFLTWTSIRLVVTEKVIVGVLALAFLVPLAANTFDLSIGHMMGFSLVITSVIARDHSGIPQVVGALIALAACALCGFISGFIVVRLKVNSFIATLGMSQVLAALTLLFSGNRQISAVFTQSYRDLGLKPIFDLPLYFYYLVILALVVWFVLEHTATGRYLFATGGNYEAARLAGVTTDRYVWGSLVVSALIGGFAGLIQSWKTGLFGNDVGPGFLFPAIAAVFFGASQLRNRPNVWGSMIAVLTLAFGVKGLQLTFTGGSKPWIEPLFEGVSLLIAVAFASRQGIIKIPKRKVVAKA